MAERKASQVSNNIPQQANLTPTNYKLNHNYTNSTDKNDNNINKNEFEEKKEDNDYININNNEAVFKENNIINDEQNVIKSIETIMKLENMSVYNNSNERSLLIRTETFYLEKELCKSLQGNVYSGFDKRRNKKIIIKRSDKILVNNQKTKNGGRVEEDIVNEFKILQRLTDEQKFDDCGFAKYVDFFQDDLYYYLITEHGGTPSLEYFKDLHINQIPNRNLSINELKLRVEYYFAQLVNVIYYLHNRNIAHLDIKLDNCVIDLNNKPKLRIIDFGVAQDAQVTTDNLNNNNNKWKYNKIVGTPCYMAPEILKLSQRKRNINKNNSNKKNKGYNPKKADIWSVGVMLFSMLTGLKLWDKKVDGGHPLTHGLVPYLLDGNLRDVLIRRKVCDYVSHQAFDLLEKIFKRQKERIDIIGVINHSYVKNAPKTLILKVVDKKKI